MKFKNHLTDDFRWWKDNIVTSFAPIRKDNDYLIQIYSDASKIGWGVVRDGRHANDNWTKTELSLHINTLKFMVAFYGLKMFSKKLRDYRSLLRIDNTTAIAYVKYAFEVFVAAMYLQRKETPPLGAEQRRATPVGSGYPVWLYICNPSDICIREKLK